MAWQKPTLGIVSRAIISAINDARYSNLCHKQHKKISFYYYGSREIISLVGLCKAQGFDFDFAFNPLFSNAWGFGGLQALPRFCL
jgi:hypothetical protein